MTNNIPFNLPHRNETLEYKDNPLITNNIPTFNQQTNNFIYNYIIDNIGKTASFHMTFPESLEWRDKIFTGTIISATKEYIIIKDTTTNEHQLLPIFYLAYIIFHNNNL